MPGTSGNITSHGSIAAMQFARGLRLCTKRGVDVSALLKPFDIKLEFFLDPNARLPYAIAEQLAEHLIERSGEPNFGLVLAQDVNEVGQFDAGLLLLMASADVQTALERMVEHQRFWGDGQRTSLHRQARGMTVRYSLPFATPTYARHADECFLAELTLGLRLFTGVALQPACLRFRHPAPKNVAEHRRIFDCTIEFGAPHSEAEFEAATLALPLQHANATFCAIFEHHVLAAIDRLPARASHSQTVGDIVRATLSGGQCSLTQTAQLLKVSPRTLQRRLHAEEVSFDAVVRSVRAELADAYFAKGLLATEVAQLLGYRDATALHHARKRWSQRST